MIYGLIMDLGPGSCLPHNKQFISADDAENSESVMQNFWTKKRFRQTVMFTGTIVRSIF